MRIRFLAEQIYECNGPGFGPVFPAGWVLDEEDVSDALRKPVDATRRAGIPHPLDAAPRRGIRAGKRSEVGRPPFSTEEDEQ